MTVKTRKQGNSVMITVPANFKVKENTEYTPVLDENGVISFIPVHENIFSKNPEFDLRKALNQLNLDDNGKVIGKENVW